MTTKSLRKKTASSNKQSMKGHDIAIHYGFDPILNLKISKDDHLLTKDYADNKNRYKNFRPLFSPEKKSAILRYADSCISEKKEYPFMFHNWEEINHKEKGQHLVLNLDIIGTRKSIAEALLIKTALEILNEVGEKDLSILVNSVGDKESTNKFVKDLTIYYRDQLDEVHPNCRELLKNDVFSLLECTHEKCLAVKEDAPRSLSYLNEDSRQHFKEVLEHLEVFDLPYKIHNHLVGNRKLGCHTLFEIRRAGDDIEGEPLAYGTRYDNMSKKVGIRKDVPSVGIEILLPNSEEKHIKEYLRPRKPKVYFVQLGFEAKIRSLKVMEDLRHAHIPVLHSLTKDKLSTQLSEAEKVGVPHILIMGHKEALENSIIVRNRITREQETIPLSVLSSYLKQAI